MEWIERLRRRIRVLARRDEFESDLEEEMRFHLGLQAEEAGPAARRQFGNLALLREESREVWTWPPLEQLGQDLRYAFRTLRKAPGFAAAAVLTMALGIGANTAVFSVVNAVVFRALPFRDPDRLAMVWEKWAKRGEDRLFIAGGVFLEWRRQSRSLEAVAAIRGGNAVVTMDGEPTEIPAAQVTGDFFDVLGVKPALGRLFQPKELQEENRVVILGYGQWQRLGGSPDMVGKTVEIWRQPHLVVGVAPRGFAFPDESQSWVPLPERGMEGEFNNHDYRVIGRLKPGVALASAQAELETVTARLRQAQPNLDVVTGVTLVPLEEEIVGGSRRALVVLFGAVTCVLLIACANVANLMLARARRWQPEIALRLALGASRWRVVRSLLTLGVLVSLAGGAVGVAWAVWGVKLFVAFDPLKLPRVQEIAVDRSVLLFTFAVAVATGVLFGLVPALRVSRPDLNQSLKEGAERQAVLGVAHGRGRDALAVTQVALAVVLLIGAGLLVRSFVKRVSVLLGFRPERVLTIELPWNTNKRVDEVLERIRALPGVQSAGAGTAFPQDAAQTSGGFSIEGDDRREMRAGLILVTPDYFHAAGMSLKRGRLFTTADGAEAHKVVVVNEALVRRYFAGRDPMGRNVRTTDGQVLREVVGIVTDVKGFGVDGDPEPAVYVPYRQQDWGNPVFAIVRTVVPPASLAGAVRREIRAIYQRSVIKIDTAENLLAQSVAAPRFYTVLLGAFAALAMALAVVGIYGVVNCLVVERTHEIGLRMALGASRRDVLYTVLGRGLVLILAGTGIGLAGSWAATRMLEGLLFQVRARDGGSFVAGCVASVAAGLLACYLPARRATRIEPMAALRQA